MHVFTAVSINNGHVQEKVAHREMMADAPGILEEFLKHPDVEQ